MGVSFSAIVGLLILSSFKSLATHWSKHCVTVMPLGKAEIISPILLPALRSRYHLFVLMHLLFVLS